MPTEQVSIQDGAQGVADKIAELEAANAEIVSVSQVGDQHIIVYKSKPKVGRPPKMETRG